MRHIILHILFLTALFQMAFGQQTGSQNFVLSRTYKQADANENNVGLVNIQVQYMDGLGRPFQTVSVKQTPDGSDFVQPIEYDQIGRLSKQYLRYAGSGSGAFHVSASAEAATWYTSNSALLQKYAATDLNRPYTETSYEQVFSRSSGNRAPGERSNNSTVSYSVNGGSEVKRYDYNGSTIAANGNYGAGTLSHIHYTDEQNIVTDEYTDKQGQLICKYSAATGYTYYVYDDLGLLRGVLQPNFQDDNSLTNSAFIYDYDERNRIVSKQIPGVGTTEMVYDKFDRVALSRDANQLARGVWGFTKYDLLDRPVMTGELASTKTRTEWKAKYDAVTAHHENKQGSLGLGYTLNLTSVATESGFPQVQEADVLTLTYHDTYDFPQVSSVAYQAVAGYPSGTFNAYKTLVTGRKARMIPGDGTAGVFLTSALFYDDEYRPTQNVRQLHDLGSTAIERVSIKYKYDLAAVVEEQKTEQVVSMGTNSHLAVYSYDHADRLLGVKETVAFGSKTKTAYTLSQRYNTLGELQSKWLHAYAADQSKYRVKTSYTNNIRGWLTDGKTAYKKKQSDPELPFYNFRVSYRNGENYSNGNVDSLKWSGKDQATFNAGSAFSYDGANRLTQSTGLPTLVGANTYSEVESGITYDKNGNIKTLTRAGAAVDNLTYTYTTAPGNRLKTVSDGSGNNTGFKSGSLGDYGYDANGNITYDINRQATIAYNYLNLPKTVAIGNRSLAYDYDASGTKHKYYDRTHLNASDTVNVKYAGIFEYDGTNAVKRVITSSGQVQQAKLTAAPGSDSLRFDYFLKDHLGNVRVVFDESGSITQLSDYYPYGLSVSRDGTLPANARNGINHYLYNGKELQVGTGHMDFGARMYLPEIGRWSASDPLSEKSRRWSSFNYCQDNPLRYIDPDGRDIIKIDGGVRFTGEDIEIAFNAVAEQVEETGGIMGIHFVEEAKTPNIYQHTLNSFRKGKPSLLHYDSDVDRRDIRRKQALKGYPSRGSEGLERDEYPFASTFEGGTGANIAYVPKRENKSQGGSLSHLYKSLKSGDAFLVFPVPRDREPETSPVPVTQTKPLLSPRDVGVGIAIGIGIYEALKWGGAIILIPETGGASIPAAAALP